MPLIFVTNQLYADWDYAKGTIDFEYCFKGKLLQNKAEARMRSTMRNMDYSILINEMFESKPGTYSHWLKENWACHCCLMEFIRDTLPCWWLDHKRKGQLNLPDVIRWSLK